MNDINKLKKKIDLYIYTYINKFYFEGTLQQEKN